MKDFITFMGIALISVFFIGAAAYLYSGGTLFKTGAELGTSIELNTEYVMRYEDDNPWYDGSRDIYVTPREIKQGWVKYSYRDQEGFWHTKASEFVRIFEKVE